MKRSPIVLLGTVAGVAGVLIMNPSGETLMTTATAEATGTSATTDPATSAAGTTAAATTPAATPSATASTSTSSSSKSSNTTASSTAKSTSTSSGVSGTATGDAIYVRYGYVQLKVTVANGKITKVTEVQMPNQDGRSMMITQQAGPMLNTQVLAAQSANINGISGATYTSAGYQQSLQSALDQLGF